MVVASKSPFPDPAHFKKLNDIARALAATASQMQTQIQEAYARENTADFLHKLYLIFNKYAFSQLDLPTFVDSLAQVLPCTLFLARASIKGEFTPNTILNWIITCGPFISGIFRIILEDTNAGKGMSELEPQLNQDKLNIFPFLQILQHPVVADIIRAFQEKKPELDPTIHFYELFLRAYHPRQRSVRGVFYTPEPLVLFIIQAIHAILKSEFGCPNGLLDSEIPVQTSQPKRINILDPAMGTGIFIRQIIRVVKQEFQATNEHFSSKQRDLHWAEYAYRDFLPRLTGFELLFPAFIIAHLLIQRELGGTNYGDPAVGKLNLHFANALDFCPSEILHDVKKSSLAKIRDRNFPIIIGNPPYARGSLNTNTEILELLKLYKDPVRGERNIQALSDDYLKFLRFAHAHVEQVGWGIVGYILNNRVLSGRVHRGVRQALAEFFDQIFIIDLHGAFKGYERTPAGVRDENVFDIQQGVCLCLLVKNPLEVKSRECIRTVKYYSIFGSKKEKFDFLLNNNIASMPWISLPCEPPEFYFVPEILTPSERAQWAQFSPLTSLFHYKSVGGKPGDDSLLVSFHPEEVLPKMQIFLKSIQKGKNSQRWTEARAKICRNLENVCLTSENVQPYLYRPFDTRWVYYDSHFWTRGVLKLKNNCHGNLILLCSKIVNDSEWAHTFITRLFPDVIALSNNSSENCFAFPLQVWNTRQPQWNLTGEFLAYLLEMGVDPQQTKDTYVLGYVYAILNSRWYRGQFRELLRSGDFPRIPLTRDQDLFDRLSDLGDNLVILHADNPELGASDQFRCNVEESDIIPPKYPQFDGHGILLAPGKGIYPVSNEIWDFKVGKYRVCQHWGTSRVGQALTESDLQDFCVILSTIDKSLDLEEKIDRIIQESGAFDAPIAWEN